MNKELFKFRLFAVYIIALSWSMTGPVLKTFFNLLPSQFFGIVGIISMIIALGQKPLRKYLNIKQLLWLLITFDTVYLIGTSWFNYEQDVKGLLIFHMCLDGFYGAVVTATSGKIESLYLGRFKPGIQDRLRGTIINIKMYYGILGLALGALLPYFLSVFGVIWVNIFLTAIAIVLEIKAAKVKD